MLNQTFSQNNFIQTVEKNTVLFREGDKDVGMYFILKGEVELSRTSGDTIFSKAMIDQGEFFGEMSLVQGQQRKATATATCDSVLMVITRENFNEVISKNPQLALHIITGLCVRLPDFTESSDKTAASETINPAADNPETAAATEVLSEKTFELTPDNYNKYCFPKEVTCPVCEHKFSTDMLRESRLHLKNRSDELRIHYEDINPLFYNVWICPNCYYSMKRTEFEKITDIQKRNLANQSDQRKANWNPDFSNKLSFDFAVTAYKIAIECCDSLGKKDIEDRIAALWLNTAWLYDDMEEPENALEARKNALIKYKNAYIFGTDRTDDQDQKIEYLVGKLSWVTGNITEARDHFFKVVNRRSGHQVLKQMARDALEQLKPLLS